MPGEWCDGFLQLVKSGQPVDGESTDMDYPESIEVLSFKFGNSSGFGDTAEFFAAQKVGDRRGVAMSRAQDNDGSIGLASLFGGEDDAPEYSEKELDQYQGKDLSEVDACNFQITKEMDISSPDLFRAYCSAQDLEHRDVFDSGTLTLRKATGKIAGRLLDLHLQRSRRGRLFAGDRRRRLAEGNDQPFVREDPGGIQAAKGHRRIGARHQRGLGFHRTQLLVMQWEAWRF